MLDINIDLTKYSRNKKYFANSYETTIIIKVIIIVINCVKDILFC